MKSHSRQILSVEEAFGANGWQAELIENRDVLRTGFEAHHTRVDLIAQAHTELNALTIVAETPMFIAEPQMPAFLEMLTRANKPLTLGSFEYDFDREIIVFRITNIFEKEKFDADIISSMVHCAIAELDRMVPYASIVRGTAADLIADLDLERLLSREDILPPLPNAAGGEEEEI